MRAAIALVSALVLAACNMAEAQRGDGETARATGTGTQRAFAAAGFDSVSLGGHHNVVVTVGGAHSVRAEGDERELQDLEITTRGSELHIGLTEEARRRGRHGRTAVTVYVTLPALAKAAIGGSGDMRIDNVQGRSFEGAIGGSGDMEIASLRVEEASFSIAGSGNIRAASGQARTTDLSIAGSGNIDLGAVESREADVSVVGSGDVQVRASEAASVSVMGSGDVRVAGQARCTVSKMGSGNVRCEA